MKLLATGMLAFAPLLNAQFTIDGRAIQVHEFLTQGFAYSNQNNYLTMPTSQGTFALTDAGVNLSSQLTDKLRVGAQAYVRNVGDLGNGHVEVDWALADYRFTDWFGVRAGKVKTVLGLYNDTQDAEFLHTWAILPQSMYPLDLRETSFSHIGTDIYGDVPIRRFGHLAYTAYGGVLPEDLRGGYSLGLAAGDVYSQRISGTARGADLRWTPPWSGLLVGASYVSTPLSVKAIQQIFDSPVHINVFEDHRSVFYGQYSVGNLRVEAEYSREILAANLMGILGPFGPPNEHFVFDRRSWYTAVAYRVSRYLELGTYNSRFFPDADRKDSGGLGTYPPAARHIFDQVFTARFDIKTFWDLKIEGHFMDGYGDPASFRGFYPQDNPMGFKPRTNLLVLRTGVNF